MGCTKMRKWSPKSVVTVSGGWPGGGHRRSPGHETRRETAVLRTTEAPAPNTGLLLVKLSRKYQPQIPNTSQLMITETLEAEEQQYSLWRGHVLTSTLQSPEVWPEPDLQPLHGGELVELRQRMLISELRIHSFPGFPLTSLFPLFIFFSLTKQGIPRLCLLSYHFLPFRSFSKLTASEVTAHRPGLAGPGCILCAHQALVQAAQWIHIQCSSLLTHSEAPGTPVTPRTHVSQDHPAFKWQYQGCGCGHQTFLGPHTSSLLLSPFKIIPPFLTSSFKHREFLGHKHTPFSQ